MRRLLVIWFVGPLLCLAVPNTRAILSQLWHRPEVQQHVGAWSDQAAIGITALVKYAAAHTPRPKLLVNGQPAPIDRSTDFSLSHGQSLTADEIDVVLRSYNSPATGTGAAWVANGQRTSIDAAYALAMFIHESTAGTNPGWAGLKPGGDSTHNTGNIVCAGYPTCFGRFRDYPDWPTGIADHFNLMTDYRDRLGKQTIGDAIYTWAPSSDGNNPGEYASEVERMVTSWRQASISKPQRDRGKGGKHPVTDSMQVNAGFDAVNCAAWASQPHCQHWGVDYAGVDGSPVYAPYDGTYVTTAAYPENDSYHRLGGYVIYLLPDGSEFYAGHLKGTIQREAGSPIKAGEILGYMRGDLNHTHIQLKDANGNLEDFQAYYKTH